MTRDTRIPYLAMVLWPLGVIGVFLAGILALALVPVADQGLGRPTCWAASTEDSDPQPVPCDYRNGAWHPVTPPIALVPCDQDTPGQPVTGPCWLSDSGTLAIWPHPYATTPLYRLEGSQIP